MGRHDPLSKSKPVVPVDDDVHTRIRVLSAQKNVTMKAIVREMLAVYDAHLAAQVTSTP
ncbi:hypothetical protein [Polyangium spumosum]|uniref:Ribbon-helix-helix protein, CopG family n=1 Tax=Polyangium spumosum TaxID=889282 RepID=A0A6N7PWV9_9BACT|nr:hypothetical protein [Polyangium spumosum]MRG96007.1 hypothetical protein [Polyangium spumosum]